MNAAALSAALSIAAYSPAKAAETKSAQPSPETKSAQPSPETKSAQPSAGTKSAQPSSAEAKPAAKAKPFTQEGFASFYSHSGRNAAGGRSSPNSLSAAHRHLPFGTRVLVTHLKSGKSVIVTINDRGPFRKGRIIDISRRAAKQIGLTGVARVSVVSAD